MPSWHIVFCSGGPALPCGYIGSVARESRYNKWEICRRKWVSKKCCPVLWPAAIHIVFLQNGKNKPYCHLAFTATCFVNELGHSIKQQKHDGKVAFLEQCLHTQKEDTNPSVIVLFNKLPLKCWKRDKLTGIKVGMILGRRSWLLGTENNGKPDILRLNFSERRFYKTHIDNCASLPVKGPFICFPCLSSSLLRQQPEHWQSQERRHK